MLQERSCDVKTLDLNKISKEIEIVLSENEVGLDEFEEIYEKIKTDYKNNPLDSQKIKKRYRAHLLFNIILFLVFLSIIFLEVYLRH